jgi:two-component system response regulator YesN
VGSEEKLNSQLDNVILSEVDPKHIDRKLIKEFLRRGDVAETEFFMREFFNGMGKNAMKSTMLRQYIAMDIYFCVTEFV